VSLGDGLHAVAPGKLATVVTHLEMTAPAPLAGAGLDGALRFGAVPSPTTAFYRDLFTRVGSERWLWTSRLELSDAALGDILGDADTGLWTLWRGDRAEAMLELDFREDGDCELAFFGLTPGLIGTGAGRFLMDRAIELAWAHPIRRFHVHTCTLDSPGALEFYRRSGFVAVRREVEIFDDPRVTGEMPAEYGPGIPLI